MKQDEFDFDAAPREPERPRSTASAAVLDRIRKLLRLAADKRGNAHEAERAAAAAFELAERHHVDVLSLDLDEEQEQVVGDYFPSAARRDRLRSGVFGILRAYFHINTCLCGDKVLFVGRETDVAIAGYVYVFLVRAGRDCRAAWERAEKKARRKVNFDKRANYIAGFIYGLHAQLRKARTAMALDDSKTALVVAEEAKREAKMTELVGETSTTKALPPPRKVATALEAGWSDGFSTKINTPLGGSKKEALALQ